MGLKFFRIPLADPGWAEEDLNKFLRSHKVLAIERSWFEQGERSCWTVCVEFLDGARGSPSPGSSSGSSKPRIDYRDVLSPAEFDVYLDLVRLRKEMAAAEGQAVYVLFKNDQLAQMVQRKVTTKAALEAIDGVGSAKVEKYGERLLALLSEKMSAAAGNGQAPPAERTEQ